jgi:hypothetical protein
MLRLAALSLAAWAAAGLASAQTPVARDTCSECHEDVLPGLANDVHRAAKIRCVDCHKGDASAEDPEKAMDPRRGFVGKPKGLAAAAMCGGCHSDIERMRAINPRLPTDQLAQYKTSEHGKRAAKGDTGVATCVSCHGAHGVLHVQDPGSSASKGRVVETCTGCHNAKYMQGRGLPTDQLEKYKRSVHGQKRLAERDPGAPACSDCHGNHGAAPPGFAAVSHVCGKCHVTQAELFEASSHAGHFKELGVATCTTCHNHHDILATSDELLGAGAGGACASCHAKGDACDRATSAMKASLTSVTQGIDVAKAALARAERLGMDVDRPTYELAAANEAVVRARVMVHAFSQPQFEKVAKEGLEIAAEAQRAAEGRLAEYRQRRVGLAVASAALLLFAGLLALKARQLESGRVETPKGGVP